MALAPSPAPTAAMPSFQAPQQPAQAAPSGKPAKPVVHGLVNVQEIDDRLAQLPREAQQYMIKAVASYPELPTIFGIAIGPEAHDYFAAMAEAVNKQKSAEAGSPDSPEGAVPPEGQNASANTAEAPPAMATSPTPPMA